MKNWWGLGCWQCGCRNHRKISGSFCSLPQWQSRNLSSSEKRLTMLTHEKVAQFTVWAGCEFCELSINIARLLQEIIDEPWCASNARKIVYTCSVALQAIGHSSDRRNTAAGSYDKCSWCLWGHLDVLFGSAQYRPRLVLDQSFWRPT